MFHPRSVAVVGASDREGSWGNILLTRLRDSGFEGGIYPINPRSSVVAGMKAYSSVRDLESPPDLAVIIVRPDLMPSALEECGEAGVPTAIGYSTGFAETGPSGIEVEDRLGEVVDRYGIRFVGPNCIGICVPGSRLNLYFEPVPDDGNVAILSQGGGVGVYMATAARERGIGLSSFLTLGNQVRTDLIDCFKWLADDPSTDAVAVYVEGAPRNDPVLYFRRLINELRALSRTKQVVVYHGGKGSLAEHLSYSHTASMAVSGALFTAACRQYGLIEALTPIDAVSLAAALARRQLVGGRRIGAIASGSQGMMLSDLCEGNGLEVPALAASDRDALVALLPSYAVVPRNPVDLAGSSDRTTLLPTVLKAMAQIPYLDALVFTMPNGQQLGSLPLAQVVTLGDALAQAGENTRKPVVGIRWMEPGNPVLEARLRAAGYLLVDLPEEAVRLLSALANGTVAE